MTLPLLFSPRRNVNKTVRDVSGYLCEIITSSREDCPPRGKSGTEIRCRVPPGVPEPWPKVQEEQEDLLWSVRGFGMPLLEASESRDVRQKQGRGFGACGVCASSPGADGGRDPLPKPLSFSTCKPVRTGEPCVHTLGHHEVSRCWKLRLGSGGCELTRGSCVAAS